MIKTTFVALAKAAELLGSDETELLVACIEKRIDIYGLVQGYISAMPMRLNEKGEWTEVSELERYDKSFAMISPWGAELMLSQGHSIFGLYLEIDEDGTYWINHGDLEGIDAPQFAERHLLFMKSEHIDSLKRYGVMPDELKKPRPHVQPPDSREYRSDLLAVLEQAAFRFWSKAEKSNPESQPTNASVAEWLHERGFSESLAEKGASIIRPDWAHLGRKPDS